jgi:TonB family protein
MNHSALQWDAGAVRSRTRSAMGVSIGVHALLLLWLVFAPKSAPAQQPLTEITMLEPGDASPAAPATPAQAAARTEAGAAATSDREAHFRRAANHADLAPVQQSALAMDDQLSARLAALQSHEVVSAVGVGTAPGVAWGHGAAPATVSGTGTSGSVALNRGGEGAGPALTLTRGTGAGTAPALAPATVATHAAEAAPEKASETGARRTLAGATLMGPIADRPVRVHVTPDYPEWAKREAVEGSVTLYFVVRADGSIKENVLVQRTAGFEDFDENARSALRAWRFEPLRDGRTGEQWGTITFHFRLRDGG